MSTMGTTPQGETGASALARVQAYTNETSLPTAATILTFLNKGLEEVVRRVGGIKLYRGYATVQNQTTVHLDDDVLDIETANFSYGSNSTTNSGTASPFTVGAMVQPMQQYDQKAFMEAAAGFPNVGFGPPQIYFVYQDQGYAPSNALPAPPAAVLAQTPGTATASTVYVVVTYTNSVGETIPSTTVSSITTTATEQAQCQSPPAYRNASGWNCYASASSTGPFYKQNSTVQTLGYPFTIPATLLAVTAAPSVNTAIGSGTGGALSMQLYPNAMVGQVNVYYRARPLLWADTTTASYTNLDTSVQEAAILFATMRVLASRQRADEIAIWQGEYESMIADLKESVNRRTVAKSGQVRDVRGTYASGIMGYFPR